MRQFLIIKFEVDTPLPEAAVHEMGERIVTELITTEPVAFDSTDVVTQDRPVPTTPVPRAPAVPDDQHAAGRLAAVHYLADTRLGMTRAEVDTLIADVDQVHDDMPDTALADIYLSYLHHHAHKRNQPDQRPAGEVIGETIGVAMDATRRALRLLAEHRTRAGSYAGTTTGKSVRHQLRQAREALDAAHALHEWGESGERDRAGDDGEG